MMRLGLIISQRCNAQCRHCYSSCGPDKSAALPGEDLLALIDEAASLSQGEELNISISGGEPFLEPSLLQALIQRGNAHGAWMSCVSNGYWAHTPTKAHAALAPLRAAGLDALDISHSHFHQDYVPAPRVKHALSAARALGLHTTLKYVSRADQADDPLCRWAEQAGIERVQRIALLPALREGVELPERAYARRSGLPGESCPGTLLSFREDGQVYGCCTPGAHTPWHALGTLQEHSLAQLRRRYRASPRLELLRKKGPIALAEAVQAAGAGARLRKAYVNACELCCHISNDPQMAAIAAEAAERHDVQNWTARLRALPDDVLTD